MHSAEPNRGEILRELYESEYDSVVRLVACLLDSVDRCEDVVQEAMVRIMALDVLPVPEKLAPYLRSTALNLARSAMRHRQTSRKYAPIVEHEHRRGPTDPSVRVQSAVALQALRGLPRRQCEVLTLRYHYDLTEREIADTLGISTGSVKTHAHRGLAALADRMVS